MRKSIKKTAVFLTILFSTVLISSVTAFASSEPTFGEKMAQAGRNTAIGLITVFAILLVLSFIIRLFKYLTPKKKEIKADKTEYVNRRTVEKPSIKDEELVAVILAAICASQGTDYVPGQYRLKSIKKVRTTRSWNRTRREV